MRSALKSTCRTGSTVRVPRRLGWLCGITVRVAYIRVPVASVSEITRLRYSPSVPVPIVNPSPRTLRVTYPTSQLEGGEEEDRPEYQRQKHSFPKRLA